MPHAPSDKLKDDVATFNKWAARFGLTTDLRIAHFLAQIAYESNELRADEENLNYSAERLLQVFPKYFTKDNVSDYAHKPMKIANRVYGGRMGNVSPNDGYRFKGRGYIQITGRANYQAYCGSGFCKGNLMAHPEWLCSSPGRMKSAMWFFTRCLSAADDDDVEKVTRIINGGVSGIAQRMYYLRMAKKVIGL